MISLAVAIAQASVPAGAPTQNGAYMACVMRDARRLEPSGESAEAIAIAATFNCSNLLMAAAEERDAAIPHPDGARHSFDIAMSTQESAREGAITAVVELRLQRRSR